MLPTAPGLTPLGFGIGGPRFFLRVAATMILNCSVELAVIMYIIEDGGKHEVRMARTKLDLCEIKNSSEIFFETHFQSGRLS